MRGDRAFILASLMAVGAAAAVFLTGLGWGLPGRHVDAFLFGNLTPWDGEKILRLAGSRPDDRTLGADVDVDPLTGRDRPILLNATDEQRAAIIRRFRLYSYQPDEMITLMALAGMRPGEGRLDPRLYQYGGLWIYGVGGMLKLAALSGNITLIPDLAYYLDFPEEFGRFYVVARLYSVLWALAGVVAVIWLARRLSLRWSPLAVGLPTLLTAGLCFALMPVVVNMAHEAKPHLPGAVLMLLAVIAACRYVDTGRRSAWLTTAVLCGAAFGMVLSCLPVFVLLPVMVILRRRSWSDALFTVAVGMAVGAAVYLLTNPYVVINAVVNREVLRSNFGNSLAMYEITRLSEGACNALSLILSGTSPLLAIAGAVGTIGMLVSGLMRPAVRSCVSAMPAGTQSLAAGADSPPLSTVSDDTPPAAVGWLLAAPALVLAGQFVMLAAGKPGEYGRFAVFIDVALMLGAVAGLARMVPSGVPRFLVLAGLLISTAWPGLRCLRGFIRDSGTETTRIQTARELARCRAGGASTLGILAEPAPYNFPPVDLFGWQVVLLPVDNTPATMPAPDVLLRVEDTACFPPSVCPPSPMSGGDRLSAWFNRRISWADRRFELHVAAVMKGARRPPTRLSVQPDAGETSGQTPGTEEEEEEPLWRTVPVEPLPPS